MAFLDREVELKLGVRSPAARAAAVRELGGARARPLESIYFDTSDCKLREAGFALRVRKDRGRWLQTLKADGDAGPERYEHERRIRTAEPELGLLEGTPVEGLITAKDQLRAVFTTRVRRRSVSRRCDESQIEFSFDEGEIVTADGSSPILELELELKQGDAGALYSEARRLAEHSAFVPAFASKAERGYALLSGAAGDPQKFRTPAVDPATPAAAAFQAIGRACLRQLTDNAELIVGGARIEAVHQARVALRRLRAALSVFKHMLTDPMREEVKQNLRWLARELDDARNLDVFIFESFRPTAKRAADPVPMAAFGRDLLAAQERAYERAAAAVASERFRTLVVDAACWMEGGAWRGDPRIAALREAPARRFARKALAKRRKKMEQRIEALHWRDPIARHRLRIHAKKMRYGSEFFAAIATGKRRRRYEDFTAALEEMQDYLGRLNDIHMGEETARAALAGAKSDDGHDAIYAAGLTIGKIQSDTPALTRSAKQASRNFLAARSWW